MKPDKNFSMALIDMDIVCYRCSVSSQDEPTAVCAQRIDDLMEYCLGETLGFATEDNFKSYLTGSGNFRYEIAKTFPYKFNRSDKEKPKHLTFARDYSQERWKAEVVDGMEADDALAIDCVKYGEDSVIVSQDKDMNTIPGWKFNFVNGKWRYDTEWTALEFFYTQILTGDSADGIKGIHRVGPKRAAKILEACVTEKELWEACVKAYVADEYSKSGQGESLDIGKITERVVENAQLLHLRRREDELWVPPTDRV